MEKAFDKVRHVLRIRALKKKKVPPALIAAIMMEYADSRIQITLDSMPMATVTMKRGVRQGSPLSPALFAIVVDMALDDIYDFWHKMAEVTIMLLVTWTTLISRIHLNHKCCQR